MKKDGWADYPFSFHDSEELGPAMLAILARKDSPVVRTGPSSRPRGAAPGYPLGTLCETRRAKRLDRQMKDLFVVRLGILSVTRHRVDLLYKGI